MDDVSLWLDGQPQLGEREFAWLRRFIFDHAGIALSDTKRAMVSSRLGKRLRDLGIASYADYAERLSGDDNEAQVAIDLLTTNETYFFREPKHFEFLAELVTRTRPRRLDVWSAASSSGEEAYSIAMVLADRLGRLPWRVLGTDISHSVLETARRAIYPLQRIDHLPPEYLRRFCLKGIGERAGTFRVSGELRTRVEFRHLNLLAPVGIDGPFDVIFLRNVLIYFDPPTKAAVVDRVTRLLRPEGYLLVSHSESLSGIDHRLRLALPAVYQKVA